VIVTKANTPNSIGQQPPVIADDLSDEEFIAMSAEEAQSWRRRHRQVTTSRVVSLQAIAGFVVSLVVLGWFGRAAGISAAYGAIAVIVPAIAMARGLRRHSKVGDPAAALMGFVMWEAVKVLLSVALLLAAPRVVPALNWLALVVGFVVTMKAYWVAAWLDSKRQHPIVVN
jgi:ATP synthase protein I